MTIKFYINKKGFNFIKESSYSEEFNKKNLQILLLKEKLLKNSYNKNSFL